VTTKEIKDVLFLFFFNLGNKESKNKEVSGNRIKIAKKKSSVGKERWLGAHNFLVNQREY
jgi:hypothetical protein